VKESDDETHFTPEASVWDLGNRAVVFKGWIHYWSEPTNHSTNDRLGEGPTRRKTIKKNNNNNLDLYSAKPMMSLSDLLQFEKAALSLLSFSHPEITPLLHTQHLLTGGGASGAVSQPQGWLPL